MKNFSSLDYRTQKARRTRTRPPFQEGQQERGLYDHPKEAGWILKKVPGFNHCALSPRWGIATVFGIGNSELTRQNGLAIIHPREKL